MSRLSEGERARLKQILADPIFAKAFKMVADLGTPGGFAASTPTHQLAKQHAYLCGYHDFARNLVAMASLIEEQETEEVEEPWGHIGSDDDESNHD